jgi:phosphoglycerate-specific signal transduction histidine kinase
MEKLTTFLQKYGILIILFMFLITMLNTCSISNQNEKNVKRMNRIDQRIDSISSVVISKKEFEKELKIYNLKVEKSTLHNMNEIVLKDIRPSQRIAEIDAEISNLESGK